MAKVKSTPVLKTREAVEALVNETVAAQIERERRVAKRDGAILAITEEHAPKIDALSATIETNVAIIEQWADHDRTSWGDAQSIAIAGHRIGYRIGQPAVKPAGKLKFPAIVKIIQALGDSWVARFLRIKTELNKESVLEVGRAAASADPNIREIAATELSTIGCTIEQDESFYLDPAREGQADTVLRKEAA